MATRATAIAACALATVACKRADSRAALAIGGDALFDGTRVELVAARGETIGVRVEHAGGGAVTLAIGGGGVHVDAFAVEAYTVRRPSTQLYGGSRGAGDYPDGLVAASAPTSDPAWFEIAIARDAVFGARTGELVVDGRRVPIALTVARVTLRPLAITMWAYEDPREFGWAGLGESSLDAPSDAERACIAMFHERGVQLSPDLPASAWSMRQSMFHDAAYIPVLLPDDPAQVGEVVRFWQRQLPGNTPRAFAIPIDEPHTAEARARVRAVGDAVHAAGRGVLMAVTDEPRPEYGDAVDLYISLRAHRAGDRAARWTYNGAPPSAGSMVLDAAPPGPRTWGVIAWRWHILEWYVWDALYWHDRHNAKRRHEPLPGPALDPRRDALSFDDGEDHGNLDGVLALPGDAQTPCKPTLRLEAIRRANFDRELLEIAERCAPEATAKLAAELVPTALGDAPARGAPSWPSDEAAWETARREMIELAATCTLAP